MLWAVLSIFIGALLAPALHRLLGRPAAWLFAALPLGILIVAIQFVPRFVAEGQAHDAVPWIPSLGVDFAIRLDGISFVFLVLICGIGALIFIHASAYLRSHARLGRFYAYLLLFTGSMAGLVLADNVFFLFVCWELTSVSSFLLIAWDHERPEARKAALTALLMTGGGDATTIDVVAARAEEKITRHAAAQTAQTAQHDAPNLETENVLPPKRENTSRVAVHAPRRETRAAAVNAMPS